ncbi:MAG: metal-dependent hydrolase [Clostridiales bacterium]|nr:metal-dependent hydrolase [Clostridiales bacterium]
MIIEYLGHSALYIESNDFKALIDPFLKGNPQAKKMPTDFKEITHIFVTHGHDDHIGDTIEIAKNTNAKVVANFEIINYLLLKGIENVHPMHIGGRIKLDFGTVKMTQALHGSSIMDNGEMIYGGNPSGFLLEIDGKKIYHAGDTGLTMDMKLLEDEEIDIAFLPIGGNFTMDIVDAAKAVELIKPKKVVPIHYNTFDLIKASPEEFRALVKNSEVIIMKPNEEYHI